MELEMLKRILKKYEGFNQLKFKCNKTGKELEIASISETVGFNSAFYEVVIAFDYNE